VLRALTRTLLGIALAIPFASGAQEFPTRPVSIVVAGAPGLPADIVARTLAPAMSQSLGQQVIVENKLGAGSLIGYEHAARSKPDGYTIAVVSVAQLASFPATVKDLRFDPLKDLPPFIGLGEARVLLVGTRANVTWTHYAEMVAWFKANPGKLNFGVSAPNTVLLAHALMQHNGIIGQLVPYSNASPLVTDMVSGVNHLIWLGETAVPTVAPRVRLLGISGSKRSPASPEAPTFDEVGLPGIPGLGYSLNAPAGVPAAVLERLFRAVSFALDQPEVKARFAQLQLEISRTGAEAANREFLQTSKLFSEVGARAGFVPQ
jgi:tripartite-type tricarboxylate transporter receptor subunit TctC